MRRAYDILNHYASALGWDDNSLLMLACEYIDNQQAGDAFEDHVRRQAEEEVRLAKDLDDQVAHADIQVIDPVICPRCGRKFSGSRPQCIDCTNPP